MKCPSQRPNRIYNHQGTKSTESDPAILAFLVTLWLHSSMRWDLVESLFRPTNVSRPVSRSQAPGVPGMNSLYQKMIPITAGDPNFVPAGDLFPTGDFLSQPWTSDCWGTNLLGHLPFKNS
jgi:hypothetical protein